MRRWYLLKTKVREERRAQENLENQRYQTYLPKIRLFSRSRGSVKERIEPLFPGYLFILLDVKDDNWAPIRSTRGVLQIVRFGASPASLSTDIVESLKAKEVNGHIDTPNELAIKPGDKVTVMDGCFEGLEAVFCCHSGEERSIVLLNVIGKETRVFIKSSLLDKSS